MYKRQPFESELAQYLAVLRDERGLSVSTVEKHGWRVGEFLRWIGGRNMALSGVTSTDVADYILLKRTTCSVPSLSLIHI